MSTANQLAAHGLVSTNFGQTDVMDQSNNQVSTLGVCCPVVIQEAANAWNYFYTSTLNDNTPITISYPSNSIITVLFPDFDSAVAFVMYDYVLQLKFTLVK